MKRSGKQTLPESEFYLTISMDMQWCSPRKAKLFVKNAIKAGFLKKKDDQLSPTFDVKKITIPTGFKPSDAAFDEPLEKHSNPDIEIIEKIKNNIERESDLSSDQIRDEINMIAEEKIITPVVAALLLAKRFNININQYIKSIK